MEARRMVLSKERKIHRMKKKLYITLKKRKMQSLPDFMEFVVITNEFLDYIYYDLSYYF